jgi:hypothetical protein
MLPNKNSDVAIMPLRFKAAAMDFITHLLVSANPMETCVGRDLFAVGWRT